MSEAYGLAGQPHDLPTRDEALALLHEFTTKPGLIQHALAVEAATRAYAEPLGGDPHAFALAGLLHDFDYERYPDLEDHPFRGAEILADRGYPEPFRRAILSHGNHTGVPRETPLEKALFACDELSGFLVACALVQPDRALRSVKVKSVKKKLKAKAFAASVNRDDIREGAADLGVELDAHITFVLEALCAIDDELGLAGA